MPESPLFAGKTAIVTGAASGIGEAIATEFASGGAHVLIQDLNAERASETAARIRARGGSADSIGGDVSNPTDVQAAVDALLASHGRIDILVNNAGLQFVSPIDDFPLAKWTQLLNVLLTGPFLFTQAVLPAMRAQQSGRIINISSINGKRGERGKAAYCAAKHGVIGLTRVAALETAADGITVNAVCPGFVDTPLVRNQLGDLAKVNGLAVEDVLEKLILPAVPQHRLLDVSEIAGVVRFLASEAARGITGQAVDISAGIQMQ